MSGQLVGEVLAASDSLRASGLSERGFQALIAIAEKAHTQTRQGSVRWDHIRAGQYGRSLATAKRAIVELKAAGLIRVVKRGFNNQSGRSAAPIYEIAAIPNGSLRVSHSVSTEWLTQDEPFGEPDRPNGSNEPTERLISATERITQDDLLDGLTPDGPTSDERSSSPNRGTSPGAASFAPAAGINEFAYRRAAMDRDCPTCRAGSGELCRREDGEIRRAPCITRTRMAETEREAAVR